MPILFVVLNFHVYTKTVPKSELNLKKEIKEARAEIVSIEKKVDQILETLSEQSETLKKVPTRDEFPELLRKTFEFATLKAGHERMKRIIREHLKVEV